MKRLCELCQEFDDLSKDYWFEDKDGKWSKYLCKKCINEWLNKQKKVKSLIEKYLSEDQKKLKDLNKDGI